MSKVNRSTYQKAIEENKRLLADIKLLTEKHTSAEQILCIGKWRKKFREEKPKHFNALMNKSYYKNRDKAICRVKTLQLLKGIYKLKITLTKKCNKCEKPYNLQIHHEIYPKSVEEIFKAIKDKKIYYLCKKHHIKEHKYLKI